MILGEKKTITRITNRFGVFRAVRVEKYTRKNRFFGKWEWVDSENKYFMENVGQIRVSDFEKAEEFYSIMTTIEEKISKVKKYYEFKNLPLEFVKEEDLKPLHEEFERRKREEIFDIESQISPKLALLDTNNHDSFLGILGTPTKAKVDETTVCIGDIVNYNNSVGIVGIYQDRMSVIGFDPVPISEIKINDIVKSYTSFNEGINEEGFMKFEIRPFFE